MGGRVRRLGKEAEKQSRSERRKGELDKEREGKEKEKEKDPTRKARCDKWLIDWRRGTQPRSFD